MMKAIGVVALVLLMAGASYGLAGNGPMNPTNGLNVYWYGVSGPNSSTYANQFIRSATRGVGWSDVAHNVTSNNVTTTVSTAGWSIFAEGNVLGPDMWDPQADRYTGAPIVGAQGRTVIQAHVPEGTLNAAPENQWSIIRLTPGGGYDLVETGPGLNTLFNVGRIVKAPDNLLGLNTHGLAVHIVQGNGDYSAYLNDANNDGLMDTTTSPDRVVSSSINGYQCADVAFGPDNALYWRRSLGGGATGISREYYVATSGATTVAQTYANFATLGTVGGYAILNEGYPGVAVGQGHGGAPIVYFSANTSGTDEDNSLLISSRASVIAAQDTNGDNVITPGLDTLALIWREGRFGVTTNFIQANGNANDTNGTIIDLEYDSVSQSIVLAGAWQSFVVIALDNTTGLSAIGARNFGGQNTNDTAGQPWGIGGYFTLDPIPFPSTEIPEPATMLLVGTGALGLFGYIRRRKMA